MKNEERQSQNFFIRIVNLARAGVANGELKPDESRDAYTCVCVRNYMHRHAHIGASPAALSSGSGKSRVLVWEV